jgi:hypothetical protein
MSSVIIMLGLSNNNLLDGIGGNLSKGAYADEICGVMLGLITCG